jgi:hypothetical protein
MQQRQAVSNSKQSAAASSQQQHLFNQNFQINL